MKVLIRLYRDDGTLLIEQLFQRMELGEKQEINLHRMGGPVIDNGMAMYAITIQAAVVPTAPVESAEVAASGSPILSAPCQGAGFLTPSVSSAAPPAETQTPHVPDR